MSGPTKGAELKADPGKVWAAHPNLAGLLRLVVVLTPLGVSILFSWWVGRVAPPDELGMNRWLWLACLFVASTVVVLLFQRLLRRTLPLVALMKLTLVFPDQAPSRARAALRASSGRSLQASDLDGEGDLDLAFGSQFPEPDAIWLNDGVGVGMFTDSGQTLGSLDSRGVAVADIDGDGDLDLAFAHDGDANTAWLNDGSGAFSDSGQSLGLGATTGVSFADLDGGGDLDAVTADNGDGNRLWLNG